MKWTLVPARWGTLVSLAAILMGAFLLELTGVATAISQRTRQVLEPLLVTETTVARVVAVPYHRAWDAWQAAARIQDLELRAAEYQAQLSQLEQLKQENQALRKLLENTDRTLEQRLVTSPIVSYALPAVAVGTEDGIQSGALVLIQNTLVGRVTDPAAAHAQILLLSHPQAIPILAQTESGVRGLVKGTGRSVVLTEVPLDQNLNIGDRVVTAGQEGVKKGVYIGTITSLENRDTAPVKTAILDQFVSFYESPIVEVLVE